MEVEGAGGLWPHRRKRTRFPPPPPPGPFDDSDDDDDRDYSENVENRAQDDDVQDAAASDEAVDEVNGGEGSEYDPFDVYGGGDVVEGQRARGGDEPQQQGRADSDDEDDIPIIILPRRRTALRPEPTAPWSPAGVGDGRLLRLRSVRRAAISPHPGSTTAPAPAPSPMPVAAATPKPPEPSPSSSWCSDSSSSSVIRDATVDNSGAIDCVICFLPLKPPIFQCNVGHVVCSRCSERQGQATNCHECRAPTPGGYTRCHAMEKVVDSIRVPCPHAAHGCAHRPPYHARDAHALACPHKPCHCPGDGEPCGFAGSAAALADHLAAAHGWPCVAVDGDDGGGTHVFLRDGFNFVTTKDRRLLFLLDVRRAPPFGRAVAAFCIHPDRAATATLKLTHNRAGYGWMMHSMCKTHLQSSEFKVACTDLADGVPDPSSNDCFQFVLPGSVREDDDGATTTTVVVLDIVTPPRPSS